MIEKIQTHHLQNLGDEIRADVVAIEEPLEIQLQSGEKGQRKIQPLSVTMRTPGQDEDLALGFLFTEGIITSKRDLDNPTSIQLEENKILVCLSGTASFSPDKLQRNFYTTSSCGVCGKTSIEAIHQECRIAHKQSWIQVDRDILFALPDRLREVQKTFTQTGGIHAAAFFDREGNLISFREDVGRHNALDKLIGAQMMEVEAGETEIQDQILLLSGRASFELIQKAAMAGVQIVGSIGAPSSLAVKTASSFGITLVGFLKSNSANVYCGLERLMQPNSESKNHR